ncbi:hypothetical protein, partial [Burkholderia pseudomallei]|uniref:hypothetical protein n=1 Tax=Burkholderia pseudomallei TaxID=28450 RepID=UPI0027E418A4
MFPRYVWAVRTPDHNGRPASVIWPRAPGGAPRPVECSFAFRFVALIVAQTLLNDTFLRALLREPTDYTPIWLMR